MIPSRARLVGLGVMAAAAAFVVVSSILAPRHTQLSDRLRASPAPGSGAAPSASPVRFPSPAGPTAPLSPPAAGHTDPVAVARGWALAEQTWDWRDQPDPGVAARNRAVAWSTPAWAAVMAQSSSAGYLTAQRVAAHEVDSVSINSVVEQDPSTATSKVELVLSTVMVTRQGSAPSPKPVYLQLTVVQQADGSWAVDNVAV